jgi:hypothetical protein
MSAVTGTHTENSSAVRNGLAGFMNPRKKPKERSKSIEKETSDECVSMNAVMNPRNIVSNICQRAGER